MQRLRIIASVQRLLMGLLLLLPIIAAGNGPEKGPVQRDHIEVELVAEHLAVQPGSTFRVGLGMLPEQGWHTYWINPGDSGLPIELEWTAPPGSTISTVDWPYPDRLPIGHLVNFGYEGEHLLPVTVEVPSNLVPGQTFVLDLYADWLVCRVECIPGDADLRLELPIVAAAPAPDPATRELFAWANARRPEIVDWPARFSTEGGQLSVQTEATRPLPADGWAFFPATENLVDHAGDTFITVSDGLALVLAGMVALAFALWLAGRPDRGQTLAMARHVGVAMSLLFALAALGSAARLEQEATDSAAAAWEPWSPARLRPAALPAKAGGAGMIA